jgi:uncharacterized protein YjbI with pentapeptide repeats
MKLFLSYASEDHNVADQVQLALLAAEHNVFFDKQSLPAAGDFHARIRAAIQASDGLIFLISPHAVDPGSYTLTELSFARERWPHPKGRVLPVLLPGVSIDRVPNYLKAATLLQPHGNVPAEIVAAIERSAITSASPYETWRRLALGGILGSLVLLGMAGLFWKSLGGTEGELPMISFDAAVANLSQESPERRIAGADALGTLGSRVPGDAQRALLVLAESLHRRAPLDAPPGSPSSKRNDVVAMLKAISTILKVSDQNGSAVQRPDLKRLDLSGLDLPQLYLRSITIMETSLEGTTLTGADLAGATLINVRLDGIKARKADFSNATFRSVCAEEADLDDGILPGLKTFFSDLNAAGLNGARLAGAAFTDTRLSGTDFKDADLSGADLSGGFGLFEAQLRHAKSTRDARLPNPVYQHGTSTACARRP